MSRATTFKILIAAAMICIGLIVAASVQRRTVATYVHEDVPGSPCTSVFVTQGQAYVETRWPHSLRSTVRLLGSYDATRVYKIVSAPDLKGAIVRIDDQSMECPF